MVQFRKSKKIGPVRITASKKGLGISAGAGPVRISRGADGKVRRTVRAPGTGIYDTKVIGGNTKPRAKTAPAQSVTAPAQPEPQPTLAPTRRLGAIHLNAGPITVKGYNGTVTFDGANITITRKGLTKKLGGLRDAVTFPITDVAAVEWKEPSMAVNGHLRFVVPLADGTLLGDRPIPEDDYAVLVVKHKSKTFDDLRGALAVAVANPSRP